MKYVMINGVPPKSCVKFRTSITYILYALVSFTFTCKTAVCLDLVEIDITLSCNYSYILS
jgi:hypothetical protein